MMDLVERLSLVEGQIVLVRARLVQDFGGDMRIEIIGPNVATKVHVRTRHVIGSEALIVPMDVEFYNQEVAHHENHSAGVVADDRGRTTARRQAQG